MTNQINYAHELTDCRTQKANIDRSYNNREFEITTNRSMKINPKSRMLYTE